MRRQAAFGFFVLLVLLLQPCASAAVDETCDTVDLSDMAVHKTSRLGFMCSSWIEEKYPAYFKIGCSYEGSQWRAYAIKPVDVSGSRDTLRIKAKLSTTTDMVYADDYVQLVVFDNDKSLSADLSGCKDTNVDWTHQCIINDTTVGALGHCALARYATSRLCDFTVNSSGLETVYLTFIGMDAWDAGFGVLRDGIEDVQVCRAAGAARPTFVPTRIPAPVPTATLPTQTPTPTPTPSPTPTPALTPTPCPDANETGKNLPGEPSVAKAFGDLVASLSAFFKSLLSFFWKK